MESSLHLALKHAAAAHFTALGCSLVAAEVWCPIHRAIVDVAATRDLPDDHHPSSLFPGLWPETHLIECKASRADLLVCARAQGPIVRQRRALRTRIRAQNLSAQAHATFEAAAVQRALRKADARLYAAAKFELFARYRLANHLWLVVPRGLISADEVPPGWGVLEAHPHGAQPLSLFAAAPRIDAPPRFRGRLLGNILRRLRCQGPAHAPPPPGIIPPP